ncbi:MAG: dNTP triphosphohydrolase [Halobacteriota archaeon]
MSATTAGKFPEEKYGGSLSPETQKYSKRKECLESRIFSIPHSNQDRSEYLHDRDRIIYSRAFRRLASKTQVVTASGGITSDHLRNRLTHSLEVMQIASSIALVVNRNSNKESGKNGRELYIIYKNKKEINLDLIQAIALGHDIGHTAFGHAGEKALFNFLFYYPRNNHKQNGKFHHTFQGLKVCCFLEKAYKPDFFGLNLTIATLDGIFKHSMLKEEERKRYKDMFDSYHKVFWVENDNSDSSAYFDGSVYKKLTEYLFEYVSPVTCEGIIVAIADEIAQLCHDIEDIRRLGEFEAVREFYEVVKNEICNLNLIEKDREVYNEFEKALNEVNEVKNNANRNIVKLERFYIKLMINLSISIVSKVIKNLRNMDKEPQMKLLKEKYFGEFGEIKKCRNKLILKDINVPLINSLIEIRKEYIKTLMSLPDVAKWDIKGKDLYDELSEILYKALNHKKKNTIDGDSFTIFNRESRSDILKSYKAGEKYQEKIRKEIEGIPIKFAVLDYLAGMTDSFTIKEYESLTFKRVELR